MPIVSATASCPPTETSNAAPATGRSSERPEELLHRDSPIANFRSQPPDALAGLSTAGGSRLFRHIRQLALPDRCPSGLINSFLAHWPQLEILSAFDVVCGPPIHLAAHPSLRWMETDVRTAERLDNRDGLPTLVLHPPAALLCGASPNPGPLMLHHLAGGSATLRLAAPDAVEEAISQAHHHLVRDGVRGLTPAQRRQTTATLRLLPHELLPRPGPLDWSGLLSRCIALPWTVPETCATEPLPSDAALSQACRQALEQLRAANSLLTIDTAGAGEPGHRLARLMQWVHDTACSHNGLGRPTDAVIHQTAGRLLAQWHPHPPQQLSLSDHVGSLRRPMALPPPSQLGALRGPQPPRDGVRLHLSLDQVEDSADFAARAALLEVSELRIDQLHDGHLPDGAAIASVRTLDLRRLSRPGDIDVERLESDFARMPLLMRVDTPRGVVHRPRSSQEAPTNEAATQLRKMK